ALTRARRGGARGAAPGRQVGPAGDLCPALGEVLLDVGNRLALQLELDVVPIRSEAYRMGGGIPAVAGEAGQVHAADEGEAAVDDDGLLVVGVGGTGSPVQRHLQVTPPPGRGRARSRGE